MVINNRTVNNNTELINIYYNKSVECDIKTGGSDMQPAALEVIIYSLKQLNCTTKNLQINTAKLAFYDRVDRARKFSKHLSLLTTAM